jgi:ABC-2 type transport system ATP-binding protein
MTTIELRDLTKRFGATTAVDQLTLDIRPGAVTGLLGPNAAGKTTTLRMLLGLIRPDGGTATVGGMRYDRLPRPARLVGAALDGSQAHPGRTGRDHLRVLAAAAGVPDSRCADLLGLVELSSAADKRVGGYSLGMRQRLALAVALLGDPEIVILDEPTNGLDPAGIRWLRDLLRSMADRGRTVLVSSHQLSEIVRTVDDVVVMAAGRLLIHQPLAELTRDAPDGTAPAAALENTYLRLTGTEGR